MRTTCRTLGVRQVDCFIKASPCYMLKTLVFFLTVAFSLAIARLLYTLVNYSQNHFTLKSSIVNNKVK